MIELKEPFTIIPPVDAEITEVRTEPIYTVSSTIYPADATTLDLMYLAEKSGVLDFWNDPAEDVYGEDDNGL
jgi:hypothetical protein